MPRRLLTLLLAALLGCALLAAPSQAAGGTRGTGGTGGKGDDKPAWTVARGVAFNDPVGSRAARTVLIRRVIEAVNHTRKGERIHFAIYSFDRRDVADALIRAYRRGVHVQVLLNDNWTSSETRRMQRVMGRNPRKNSFVRICTGSCRGGPGNLHMKVYAFTKTGDQEHVVMTGSTNLTDRAVELQWNDLMTIIDEGLHTTFVRLFRQAKFDKAVKPRWVSYSSGTVKANFYRTHEEQQPEPRTSVRKVSQDRDPVMQRLRRIECKTAKGYGIDRRTSVRISMYGWQGERGKYLAERVVELKRQGCRVRVIMSVPGGGVLKILRQGGVETRSADWKYTSEGIVDFYAHLKFLAVNGTVGGAPRRVVWTGSENWSPMSFRNDELTVRMERDGIHRAYLARFNSLWRHSTHQWGYKPTGYPPR